MLTKSAIFKLLALTDLEIDLTIYQRHLLSFLSFLSFSDTRASLSFGIKVLFKHSERIHARGVSV